LKLKQDKLLSTDATYVHILSVATGGST